MRELKNNSDCPDLLDVFEREAEVEYRGERYLTRDNGAVYRFNQYRQRKRPLDKQWTFGKQSSSTGYMLISGERLHRIVCSAFHGAPPSDQHVVDHIDTNRANNRPENLRWVTRFENILLNPISARRIELICGSLEAFFEDPGKLASNTTFPEISWMRTVSKEEAATSKERLENWVKNGLAPRGGALGDWIFGTSKGSSFEPEPEEYESLTPSVVQVRWKVPTEFPECPERVSPNALEEYAENLRFGKVFARNDYYSSVVVQRTLSEDGLVVLTHNPEEDAIKHWAVAIITVQRELFYHSSKHQYFTLQGALEMYCELSGADYNDHMDKYC